MLLFLIWDYKINKLTNKFYKIPHEILEFSHFLRANFVKLALLKTQIKRQKMKKALLCLGLLAAFSSGEEFSIVKNDYNDEETRVYKTSDFMLKKAVIKGDDVNLRKLPRISSTALNAANNGDSFVVESVPIFDEESKLYWYKIIGKKSDEAPLFVAEKFVELSALDKSDEIAKLFATSEPKEPQNTKKYGFWRDFTEVYSYKIGDNIHEIARIWGNGKLQRSCDAPPPDDGYIDRCMSSYFEADGIFMYFNENPEKSQITTCWGCWANITISKKGYKIAGLEIGKTTKDEALKLYGKTFNEVYFENDEITDTEYVIKKNNTLVYPSFCNGGDKKDECYEPTDKDSARDSLYHANFQLIFDEKSGALKKIEIENRPYD